MRDQMIVHLRSTTNEKSFQANILQNHTLCKHGLVTIIPRALARLLSHLLTAFVQRNKKGRIAAAFFA
jgi:hypothetical protein